MALGFTPVAAKQVKLPDQTAKLTPVAEIQANLSHYFSEIKDPRVTRTKKHLLKDILSLFCHSPIFPINKRFSRETSSIR